MQVTNESPAATCQGLRIATTSIAGEVHRHTNQHFYVQLLNGLQTAAQRLGYYFGSAESAAAKPTTLEYWLCALNKVHMDKPSTWPLPVKLLPAQAA